jgi:Circularly permutated YpsA SLOG family
MKVERIISGGQTGVDRAVLDTAIEIGIPHGGWVPHGRWAEDGRIGEQYHVKETPSEDVNQRTEWNVRDSDATLIISQGVLTGGSEFTQKMAQKYQKPWLYIDLAVASVPEATTQIQQWLAQGQFNTLNIAGPRHSEDAEIYLKTSMLLRLVFR